jgi:hypothetical protein
VVEQAFHGVGGSPGRDSELGRGSSRPSLLHEPEGRGNSNCHGCGQISQREDRVSHPARLSIPCSLGQ